MMETFLFFLILFFLSASFSGSESGIFSLRESFKGTLEEREDFFSQCLLQILSNKSSILIVILVMNLVVNTLLSSFASELAVQSVGESGLVWSIPLITILIIILGEILPKTLALKNAQTVALFVSPFLLLLSHVLSPVTRTLQKFSDCILKFLARMGSGESRPMNAEELSTMITIGESEGVFNRWEKKLVEQIFAFREVYAAERMTPRPDVVAVEEGMSRQQMLQILENSRRSKLPVYRTDLDQIIGYFQSKDMLLFPDRPLKDILRPVLVIPEMKPMDLLLRDMQQQNIKMAILLDEYGSFQGLLTLEDVLETIFGELEGEQKSRRKFRKLDENTWIVSGQLSLRELEQLVERDLFSDDVEPGSNVASYLVGQLNRLPQAGDEVAQEHFTFRVTKVLKRRIQEVQLRFLTKEGS